MLDFKLTEQQIILRETVRKFADEQLEPHAATWDREACFARSEIISLMKPIGLLGMTVGPEFGGAGAPFLDFIIVLEQLARVSNHGAFVLLSTTSGPVKLIEAFADERLREEVMVKLTSGEALAALAITESDAGSDVGALRTRVVSSDGSLKVTGTKLFVGGAGDADYYVVFGRMSEAPGSAGVGLVLVRATTPGLSFGATQEMMGMRGVPRRELIFDEAPVPSSDVLSEPGRFREIMEVFNAERVHSGALALGMAQGAFEEAVDYAAQRVQFGKPINEFQGIQWMIADMVVSLSMARPLLYSAARQIDMGTETGLESAVAKVATIQMALKVIDISMQIQGAYGYAVGSRVERAYRDARGHAIATGTIEILRNFIGGSVRKNGWAVVDRPFIS